MKSWSDTIVGLALIMVLVGYLMLNQTETARSEAILGEISQIMNDLEQALQKAETAHGVIPQGLPLAEVLSQAHNTALLSTPDDPALMPDITQGDPSLRVGGCPASPETYILLRYDYVALTQIPAKWGEQNLRLCLDRNGPLAPNREGYDVIWLSAARQGSPHITLIPVASSQPAAEEAP